MNPLLALPPEVVARAVVDAMRMQVAQWQAEEQLLLDWQVENAWIN
jgi:hypothetical protein